MTAETGPEQAPPPDMTPVFQQLFSASHDMRQGLKGHHPTADNQPGMLQTIQEMEALGYDARTIQEEVLRLISPQSQVAHHEQVKASWTEQHRESLEATGLGMHPSGAYDLYIADPQRFLGALQQSSPPGNTREQDTLRRGLTNVVNSSEVLGTAAQLLQDTPQLPGIVGTDEARQFLSIAQSTLYRGKSQVDSREEYYTVLPILGRLAPAIAEELLNLGAGAADIAGLSLLHHAANGGHMTQWGLLNTIGVMEEGGLTDHTPAMWECLFNILDHLRANAPPDLRFVREVYRRLMHNFQVTISGATPDEATILTNARTIAAHILNRPGSNTNDMDKPTPESPHALQPTVEAQIYLFLGDLQQGQVTAAESEKHLNRALHMLHRALEGSTSPYTTTALDGMAAAFRHLASSQTGIMAVRNNFKRYLDQFDIQ